MADRNWWSPGQPVDHAAVAAVSVVGFLAWMVAVAVSTSFSSDGLPRPVRDLLGGARPRRRPDLRGRPGIGVLWALLITALATLGAVVYNACSELVGGITVTLDDVE